MICCSFALRKASQPRPMLGRRMARKNIQMLRFTTRGAGYHVQAETGRVGRPTTVTCGLSGRIAVVSRTQPAGSAAKVLAALLVFVRVVLELHRLPAGLRDRSARVH